MKTFLKKNRLLFIILLIAAFLRLWRLGSVPPSLTPDEAALGYNSYSILHTGRDEYGKFLPIIFKSFGDYKPGLYVYLDVSFVAAFGLSEFSTRLPSALAGVLSVFLIYLIVRELFGSLEIGNWKLEIAASFVAAVNPYLIYFSRAAWEANVALALTLLGIYFFLRSLRNSKFLLFSFSLFAVTLLTYQGAKLSSAIVVFVLVCVFWKEFWRIDKKYLVSSLIAGFIISTPIILSLFNGQASRLAVFSIFSYHRPPEEIARYTDPVYYFFHSESLNYFRAILGRWFNAFSGKFLFFEGDIENPLSTAPYQGVLLLSDLIFLPLGLYAFLRKKLQRGHIFFLLWLVLAPLSAAISRDTTNAVRSLNMAIPLIVVISCGLLFFLEVFQRLGIILALSFYLLAFSYFLDAYFVHVLAHYSNFWRYGYREMVDVVAPLAFQQKNIIVEQSFDQPYIYFLFYAPKLAGNILFEKSANTKDVGLVTKLGNIEFRQIDWQILKKQMGTIVVARPVSITSDYLKDASLIEEIKYLNGRDVAFDIVEIK